MALSCHHIFVQLIIKEMIRMFVQLKGNSVNLRIIIYAINTNEYCNTCDIL